MVPRATLIAVLVGVEVALVVAMAGAIRGGSLPATFGFPDRPAGMRDAAPQWSFAVGPDPAVTIDIGHADLTIETQAGSHIAVAIVPGVEIRSSGPITARDDGGTIHITAADGSGPSSFYMDDRNVHVIVPPATRVVVESAGDIIAGGLRAAASFDSPHGFITVRDFRGELTATSADGHVEISNADCTSLHVVSSNGRVVLRQVAAAHIDASSFNGRVDGTGLQLRDGRVSSSNGRVSLGFTPNADTIVSAASSNGRVHLSGVTAVPGNQANTGDNEDDGDASSATRVRIGSGSGRLDVRASNGNIDLNQEG
jgi:Putative adhesin